MKKRILSLLLCLAMVLSLMPTVTFAGDWEEGYTICPVCREWFNPDNSSACSECFKCLDCILDNADDEHCVNEAVNQGEIHHTSICSECGYCDDCLGVLSKHCELCNKCVEGGEVSWCMEHGEDGNHCEDCAIETTCETCYSCFAEAEEWFDTLRHQCYDCLKEQGIVCEEEGCTEDALDEVCGLCEKHAIENKAHCPICEECNAEWCESGGEHCVDCCVLCEQCGECILYKEVEQCDSCGLCVECCMENAAEAGCTCGDYCVNSSDWESHFCENCGTCYDEVDQCDDCRLCETCCEENACPDCGLCAQAAEYTDHFCEGCGDCLFKNDYCDTCGLCLSCCEGNSDCNYGLCVEDSDYEDHFCATCLDCFHDVDQCEQCLDDGNHYCLTDCPDDSHKDASAGEHEHNFNSDNKCTVCGIVRVAPSTKPLITRQPQDVYCRVTDVDGKLYENDDDNTFTLSVRVKDPTTVDSYQWERRYAASNTWYAQTGETNPDYTSIVIEDYCAGEVYFRCKITGVDGSVVYSNEATVYASHLFGYWDVSGADSSKHAYYCVGAECRPYQGGEGIYKAGTLSGHSYGDWVVTVEATEDTQGSQYKKCSVCGYKVTEIIPAVHNHAWATTLSWDETGHWYACTKGNCMEQKDFAAHQLDDGVIKTEPTEAADGVLEKTCSVCGGKVEATIDRLPHVHDFIRNPGMLLGHSELMQSNGNYHWYACQDMIGGTVCGAIYGEKEAHEWDYPIYDRGRGKVTVSCTGCGRGRTIHFTEEEEYDLTHGWRGLLLAPGCEIECDFYNPNEQEHVITTGANALAVVRDMDDAKISVTRPEPPVGYSSFDRWHWEPISSGVELFFGEGVTQEEAFSADKETVVFYVREVKKAGGAYYEVGQLTPIYNMCNHENTERYEKPNTAVAATCYQAGKEADICCSACNKVLTYGAVIPALGGSHDYKVDAATVVEATCRTTGYSGDTVCTKCGDTIPGDKTPRVGHNLGETEVIIAPTTTSQGVYGRRCQNDGCTYVLREGRIPKLVNYFVDVTTSAYYYDAVLWAAGNGITCGTSPTTFSPDASCTRAQAVTFLWRAAGCPEVVPVETFNDVAEDSYYEKAVIWAVSEGITKGTSETTFSPDATCTRAQFVTFLYRANKVDALDMEDNPFTDVAEGAYYYDAVLWAAENGITYGTSLTTFSPDANCTRAQAVTFLYRYMGK